MKAISPSTSKIQSEDEKASIHHFGSYVFFEGETDTHKFALFFDGASVWVRRMKIGSETDETKQLMSFE